MRRRKFIAGIGTTGLAGAAGCGSRSETDDQQAGEDDGDGEMPDAAPDPRPPFRVGTRGFERRVSGGYAPHSFSRGHLGMTKPRPFSGVPTSSSAEICS